jgi:glutamate dehydrogenase/leucine dehydrogenase|tara:strand:+ start:315 stop:590 length:276 start_codon:yes stop_codon:yes gene_type:complete
MITEHQHLAFPANPIHLASILTGKTVRYKNSKNRSSITEDGVRTFKIVDVEDVFTSQNSGTKCVTVSVKDIDDAGSLKYRTLHVGGIQSVA